MSMNNKAEYVGTQVTCGWAEAVMKYAKQVVGQGQ